MMQEELRKSLVLLVNKMMALEYSQETIEQTLYVLKVIEKCYLEEGIDFVNKMLDQKLEENIFWSNMSQYCLTRIKHHTSEELKRDIEKRRKSFGL